jgi:hypothetical protein
VLAFQAPSFRQRSLSSEHRADVLWRPLPPRAFPSERGFAGFDGRAVTTEMPDQLIPEMFLDQGFMHALAQAGFGKLVEGAREGGFGRQSLAQRETTDAAQRTVDRQPFNQPHRRRQPQHRLGHKAFASHARSKGGRPTPHHDVPVNSSMRTHSSVWTTFSSFGVSEPHCSANSGSNSC